MINQENTELIMNKETDFPRTWEVPEYSELKILLDKQSTIKLGSGGETEMRRLVKIYASLYKSLDICNVFQHLSF